MTARRARAVASSHSNRGGDGDGEGVARTAPRRDDHGVAEDLAGETRGLHGQLRVVPRQDLDATRSAQGPAGRPRASARTGATSSKGRMTFPYARRATRSTRPARPSTCRPATCPVKHPPGTRVRDVQPVAGAARDRGGHGEEHEGDAGRLSSSAARARGTPPRGAARGAWRTGPRPPASRRRSSRRCARRGCRPSSGEITSRSAISLFESPRASSLSTSTSRGVRPAGPRGAAGRGARPRRGRPRRPRRPRRPALTSARSSAAASSAERAGRCGRGSRIAW